MKFRIRPVVGKRESLASHQVRVSRANGYGTPFAARKIWRRVIKKLGYEGDLKLPRMAATGLAFCHPPDWRFAN